MPWSEPALFVSLISAPLAFAVLWVFLRHLPLALLIALAPLPGLLAEFALGIEITTTYAFGFCVGLLMTAALQRRLLFETGDWRFVGLAGAGAAATAAPFDWRYASILAVWGALAGGAALAGMRLLEFGEAAIARGNRAAEARARLVEAASHIAVPRWALALSGIGVVMASLAWFESPHGEPPYPGFVLAAVTAFLLARDWRAAAAAAFCAVLLWLFGAGSELPFFALPALLLSAAWRARTEEGGEAWRRALEDEGAGLLFAGLGVFLLAALGGDGMNVALAFAAALLLFPALAVALWSLFPRRRSVEELYRG